MTAVSRSGPSPVTSPSPGQLRPPRCPLPVMRERKKTCNVSNVALDPGSCTARDPRRCGAVPEHFSSGLHGRVEFRLPPEGAIGVFSFC